MLEQGRRAGYAWHGMTAAKAAGHSFPSQGACALWLPTVYTEAESYVAFAQNDL